LVLVVVGAGGVVVDVTVVFVGSLVVMGIVEAVSDVVAGGRLLEVVTVWLPLATISPSDVHDPKTRSTVISVPNIANVNLL